MVDVALTVDLPHADQAVEGRLGAAPQPVDVSSRQGHLLSLLGKLLLAVLVAFTALVVGLRLRVRHRRRKRMMRSSLPRR
jgi:hypothetical protein